MKLAKNHDSLESKTVIFAQRLEKVELAIFTRVARPPVCFGHGAVPKVLVLVAGCQGFDVDRCRAGREVEVSDEVDVAPGDGRDALEDLDPSVRASVG